MFRSSPAAKSCVTRTLQLSIAACVVTASALAPSIAFGGQNPQPSAQPPSSVTKPQAGTTTPPPATTFVTREELTGDWGSVRTRWKDKGVVLDSSFNQFYQGIASGGVETGGVLTGDETDREYTGTFDARLTVDLGKLWGWEYWSAEVKTEWRFGGPLLIGTGSINPVNTAAMMPSTDGNRFSVTALNVTRLFPVNLKEGKLVALSFGRYNFLDLIEEDFFGGSGTERFFNIAQNGPLTVLRQVPLVTSAINLAYLRGGEPFVTFSLIDPNDHSLDPGIDDLFEDGVTFAPGIAFPVKYGGKTARHSFGGAITTKEYTPFDAIRQIILPGPPLNPVDPQAGSWSVNYVFRQYFVERAAHDGWGVFTQVAFADHTTSPVVRFFDIGLGGNGLIAARPRDEFGIVYAYTDLSSDLKDNLDFPLLGRARLRAEHQFEGFYDYHLTPWFQVTFDLQILRPNRPIADTAVVPGGRLRIVF